MASPENPQSKDESQGATGSSPSDADETRQQGSPEQLKHAASASINSDDGKWKGDDDKADFKWIFEKHSENFRFFIEQGLKAVGLFYAIVGGILSIYFARQSNSNSEVLKFLLWAPFIISVVLGLTFLWGGLLWKRATEAILPPKGKPGLTKDVPRATNVLNFGLLTWLACIFGVLFLATGGALVWLIYSLT